MANINQNPKFLAELGSMVLYKKTQGRLTRQMTLVAIIFVTVCGCYSLSQSWLIDQQDSIKYGVPAGIAVVISWLAFRVVNFPPFAEFLIAVQAEVTKVNWPSWGELKRATIVVVCTMFFLGIVLFAYDFIWYQILSAVGVLQF